MRALILTAGLGTRLRPLTLVRAKAAVPVNGEPLVRRVIALARAPGHHRSRPQPAPSSRHDRRGRRRRRRPRRAGPLLVGTARARLGRRSAPRAAAARRSAIPGASRRPTFAARERRHADRRCRSSAMIDAHTASGALVTMALIPNPRPEKYGGVRASTTGRVDRLHAPGSRGASLPFHRRAGRRGPGVRGARGRRAGGIGRCAVSAADAERPATPSPRIVVDAPFQDIGTPADYLERRSSWPASKGIGWSARSRDRSILRRASTARRCGMMCRSAPARGSSDCIVCDGVRIAVTRQRDIRRAAPSLRDGRPSALRDRRTRRSGASSICGTI